MRFLSILAATLLTGSVTAKSWQHLGKSVPHRPRSRDTHVNPLKYKLRHPHTGRDSYTIIPQNANTTKFAVDGTKIPDVDFDIGESYAGLLPISGNDTSKELYFWFFPSSNPAASDEITIWLNGGPGCSSLEGLLQENGPFLWQYGTFKPVPNDWSWVKLTNMIWVEQPVGTGFSKGPKLARSNETEVAKEFLGFFKNFVDTFGLHNKKIYIAGESYAGFYVPYLANAMLNANNSAYYNLQGSLIYDPVIGNGDLQTQVPVYAFVEKWNNILNLDNTTLATLKGYSDACGYTAYYNKYLVYPPPGPLPEPTDSSTGDCDVWDYVYEAASTFNPCFDIYQIATTCPLLWDVLGFPGSFPYLPDGATIYFNRTDVQKAINAPVQEWEECTDGILVVDNSAPTAWTVLPSVIERSSRTLLVHGNLDYILIADGSLLAIQNMTWGGKQGFQQKPSDGFIVPPKNQTNLGSLAGSGVMGITHTERGFTFVETFLSGHMGPQYQPSAAFRQLEYLLGRVSSLTTTAGFTA